MYTKFHRYTGYSVLTHMIYLPKNNACKHQRRPFKLKNARQRKFLANYVAGHFGLSPIHKNLNVVHISPVTKKI